MLLCNRIVPVLDKQNLMNALERARSSWMTYAPFMDYFWSELRRADAVSAGDVPDDMITMNSRFELFEDQAERTAHYTLVYPESKSPLEGRLSVISPMGMALYGARVGEEVGWETEDGPRTGRVTRLLYQPEAAGDHHL